MNVNKDRGAPLSARRFHSNHNPSCTPLLFLFLSFSLTLCIVFDFVLKRSLSVSLSLLINSLLFRFKPTENDTHSFLALSIHFSEKACCRLPFLCLQ